MSGNTPPRPPKKPKPLQPKQDEEEVNWKKLARQATKANVAVQKQAQQRRLQVDMLRYITLLLCATDLQTFLNDQQQLATAAAEQEALAGRSLSAQLDAQQQHQRRTGARDVKLLTDHISEDQKKAFIDAFRTLFYETGTKPVDVTNIDPRYRRLSDPLFSSIVDVKTRSNVVQAFLRANARLHNRSYATNKAVRWLKELYYALSHADTIIRQMWASENAQDEKTADRQRFGQLLWQFIKYLRRKQQKQQQQQGAKKPAARQSQAVGGGGAATT